MDDIKRKKHITLSRRIAQGTGVFMGCLGILVPTMTHIVFPGLHCYACPLAVTICPAGIMQNLLKTGVPLFPLAFLGLYGLFLGRWWCGWICPFGLVNDIFSMLRTKQTVKHVLSFCAGIVFALITLLTFIFSGQKWLALIPFMFMLFAFLSLIVPALVPGIKRNISSGKLIGLLFLIFAGFFPVVLFSGGQSTGIFVIAGLFFILVLISGMIFYFRTKRAFILKFIILVLTIGLAFLAADTLFCKLCPSAALSAALPYLISNPAFIPGGMYWIKLGILVFTVFCLLVISRFFCRYLCPVGALLGLTNKISFLKIIRQKGCDSADKKVCKYACTKSCVMGIKNIPEQRVLTQTDCIKCGKCIEACPHHHLHFGVKVNEEDN
ncbi:MAG: 4Fe-4S binding protein [Spirochaetales bacterium]|nr:4Fe-4S binding protein [Spirochaetales bacterium]